MRDLESASLTPSCCILSPLREGEHGPVLHSLVVITALCMNRCVSASANHRPYGCSLHDHRRHGSERVDCSFAERGDAK
jgi:hypothetical protein